VVGAPTGIGRRLKNALAYGGQTERTVLLEEPETFDAELLQEEEAEAKAAAEGTRPGLTMFTDGSRLDGGATGYSVVWRKGQTWAGVKVHMGNNQEAHDVECAALARALELASQRNEIPERVTIFSNAQAAIRRMASDEPGPGQHYALQAWKHIATLRQSGPGIVIEVFFFFFFVYSLLACDLWRSWRNYVQPSSCPLSAQWRHVASTPFALRPGLSREDMKRTKEKTTRKRERTNEKV